MLVQICTGTYCKLDRGDELESKQGKGFSNELAPEKDEYKIAMKFSKNTLVVLCKATSLLSPAQRSCKGLPQAIEKKVSGFISLRLVLFESTQLP